MLNNGVNDADRHAYLIMAHDEPCILNVLLELIDDKRNDIFLHVDKKSQIIQFQDLSVNKAKLHIVPRHNISWGGQNMMLAEFEMMEYARRSGSYSYYHLISGVDLPIKSQNYIHDFFETNKGYEFIGICNDPKNDIDAQKKSQHYHLFTNHYKDVNFISRSFFCLVRTCFLFIQHCFHVSRKYELTIKKGSQWFSLTQNAVDYILCKKEYCIEHFKMIPCVDEVFIPTLMYNSPFKNSIYMLGTNEYQSCMREIDWNRGTPYVWRNEDFDYLIHSDKLFARKFSSKSFESIDIIKKLYWHLKDAS